MADNLALLPLLPPLPLLPLLEALVERVMGYGKQEDLYAYVCPGFVRVEEEGGVVVLPNKVVGGVSVEKGVV